MIFKNKNVHLTKETNSNIKIGNETIQKVQCTKFLGLYIDDQLRWTTHIKHCRSKLYSSLYALKTAKYLLTTSHMKTLYYSMIHPYLDYGIMLWGSASKSYIKSIEILQKKAIRTIMNASYNAHTKPLFKNLGILTFNDMFKLQIDKFMYESSHNTLPTNFVDIFEYNYNIHNHNTRQRHEPHIAMRETAFAGNTFIHQGPKLWPQIPVEIRESRNTQSFTRKIKIAMLKEY